MTSCGKFLKTRFLLLITTRNRTFKLAWVELKLPTEIQFPVIAFSKRLSWRVMRGMPQGRRYVLLTHKVTLLKDLLEERRRNLRMQNISAGNALRAK